MNSSEYASAEETVISGDLRVALDLVIDNPMAEGWLHFFHVEDEHHVADRKRKGKKRNRVDIRFSSSMPRPRNHFSFEAKRVSNKKSVRRYLGAEGLGCFLQANYAIDETSAGMIAYVQSATPQFWADKVGSVLNITGKTYSVCEGNSWAKISFAGGPDQTFLSRHHRKKLGNTIDVFHSFLPFCE